MVVVNVVVEAIALNAALTSEVGGNYLDGSRWTSKDVLLFEHLA